MISNAIKVVLFFFLMFSSCFAFSQNTEGKEVKKTDMDFEGMIGLSYGKDTFGINVGGPSLKFRFGKSCKIGVGAFPSLIVMDKKAYPKLGVSPILEYRNIMLITPYYGYDNANRMIWTFGLGYKFL